MTGTLSGGGSYGSNHGHREFYLSRNFVIQLPICITHAHTHIYATVDKAEDSEGDWSIRWGH